MSSTVTLVVTSIASPNDILKSLAKGCLENKYAFILIGDEKSPPVFFLEGCDFYNIHRQQASRFAFAQHCPTHHYARKNIGYLIAASGGSDVIFETDDDNIPLDSFWRIPDFQVNVKLLQKAGWVNLYRYFTADNLWPRGLPLDAVQRQVPDYLSIPQNSVFCPIQQGVVNGNPDVDAICRLVVPVDQTFRRDCRIAIGSGSWCPFNSQSTKWTKEAFALMYLPAYCSFRMTDIWRSFIAQRVAWENGWSVLFHEPDMFQKRNTHNLMKDFEDEIPGYLNNANICDALEKLNLKSGVESIPENLNICYEKLISIEMIDKKELHLLNHWLDDFKTIP